MSKPYLKIVHMGRHGPVTVKPNHPENLPMFWLKQKPISNQSEANRTIPARGA